MRKILIVDDEKVMRKKYKALLKAEKLKVVEAPKALEVANVLMREKSNLDLIILDINIPEVDGRDIYEIINEYAPDIPVMINSVLPVREQRIRISQAVDYFNKADDDANFVKKVKKILGIQ